jgi:Domain of unknown function (DUF5666)
MMFAKLSRNSRDFVVSLFGILFLNGCGGDLVAVAPGGGGTGAVDDRIFVAIGPVTNVNPLTVNNISFSTAAAVFSIEAGDDDGKGLQVGMVVRVNGRTGSNGANPQAFSVSTGAELRGPIAAVDAKTQTFSSVGVVVETNASTQFEGFSNSFNSMGAGDYVQVHGYPSGDGRIRATLIKKRPTNAQVKVTANVGRGNCTLCQPGSDDFQFAGLAVQPQPGVRAPSSNDPGKLVKVTGELSPTPGILIAREIEDYRVAATPSDGSRLKVQGLFAGENGSPTFTVSGLPVRVTASTQIFDPSKFGNALLPGNLLEIAGDFEKGEITAIEVQRK